MNHVRIRCQSILWPFVCVNCEENIPLIERDESFLCWLGQEQVSTELIVFVLFSSFSLFWHEKLQYANISRNKVKIQFNSLFWHLGVNWITKHRCLVPGCGTGRCCSRRTKWHRTWFQFCLFSLAMASFSVPVSVLGRPCPNELPVHESLIVRPGQICWRTAQTWLHLWGQGQCCQSHGPNCPTKQIAAWDVSTTSPVTDWLVCWELVNRRWIRNFRLKSRNVKFLCLVLSSYSPLTKLNVSNLVNFMPSQELSFSL